MSLQQLVSNGYNFLLNHSQDTQIILLHPKNKYRSLIIAKFLDNAPAPVFYYRMGQYDHNIQGFLSSIIQDLSEQASTFGSELAFFTKDPEPDLPSLTEILIQEISHLSDERFFLLLDEFDTYNNDERVQSVIETLLHNLPSHCHVIINSRTLPRLMWYAMVATKQAAILNDTDYLEATPYTNKPLGEAVAQIHVTAFGPSQIQKDGEVITKWEGHLPRLLYIFALERPITTRQEICEAFWPNLDMTQAVNVFHVTKRRLHKALSFDALIHEHGYYQVNSAIELKYDVVDFVNALMRGRNAVGENAVRAWQDALNIYKGAFLQGHHDEWLLQQREAYEAGYVEALIQVAQHRKHEGRSDQALRMLLRASSHDVRYSETLHKEIMALYSQQGRRSEVVSHYQSIAELFNEGNKRLSEDTQQFYQQLMST